MNEPFFVFLDVLCNMFGFSYMYFYDVLKETHALNTPYYSCCILQLSKLFFSVL